MHTKEPMVTQYGSIRSVVMSTLFSWEEKRCDDVFTVERASCEITAICKWDVEPTLLTPYFPTVAESDQSSYFMYPHRALRS